MRYAQLEGYANDERESFVEKAVLRVCSIKRHAQRRKRAALRMGVVARKRLLEFLHCFHWRQSSVQGLLYATPVLGILMRKCHFAPFRKSGFDPGFDRLGFQILFLLVLGMVNARLLVLKTLLFYCI